MGELQGRTDAVVIGGGLIGCSIAYYLSRAGLSVLLLERSWLGAGASSANQGVVGPYMAPPPIFELMFESLKMYWELSNEVGEDLGLEQVGMVIPAVTESEAKVLEEHSRSIKRSGGSPQLIDGSEVRELDPTLSRNILLAQISSEDCIVDPNKVVFTYAREARKLGAKILRFTEVTGIKVSGGAVRKVITNCGEVRTDYVINAAGAWASQICRLAGIEVPIYPMRGHILVTERYKYDYFRYILDAKYIVEAFKGLGPAEVKDEFSKFGVGASLCQHREGEWTIGASRDAITYDKDVSIDVIKLLMKRAVMLKPSFKRANIVRVFTGVRPYSTRKLPIIEELEIEGFIIAAGHKGEGVALAPITGALVAELVTEGDIRNPLARKCYELVSEPLVRYGSSSIIILH